LSFAAVSNSWLPLRIGEDRPTGRWTIQATFVLALNSMGSFTTLAVPDRFGPRNSGQFWVGSTRQDVTAMAEHHRYGLVILAHEFGSFAGRGARWLEVSASSFADSAFCGRVKLNCPTSPLVGPAVCYGGLYWSGERVWQDRSIYMNVRTNKGTACSTGPTRLGQCCSALDVCTFPDWDSKPRVGRLQ
jgi:hypothetical protein